MSKISEELLQVTPTPIGKYQYYRIGSTTIQQLKKHGIIPKKDYSKLLRKKPDGLIVYQGEVKGVVEWKPPHEFRSAKQVKKAVLQEMEVAKKLCKLLIVTDGKSKTLWYNTLTGNEVLDQKQNPILTIFNNTDLTDSNKIENLIEEIDYSLSITNNELRSGASIDPSKLARSLWQSIWVHTSESPMKCLYNVVELFIFKFLSDLGVLRNDENFEYVYQKSKITPQEALTFYARISRQKIRDLFREGEDGTTIINGIIFVTEDDRPNLDHAYLFRKCLSQLAEFGEEVGSLTKIDKEFKTKLYENFLKQELKALGQYFTPRKIVQTIIRMSGLDKITDLNKKRICDPFCGVGGFPLEILNMNERMFQCYEPQNNKVKVPFVLKGYDKGSASEHQRTIVLAKANMLIYLAEHIFKNPGLTKEYTEQFNSTFYLFKDNLGTFGKVDHFKNEEEKFDFILTNPPYVTSGSGGIKEELKETARTKTAYPIDAQGLEGLGVEWIINSLKKGGKAFIILPDGIMMRVHDRRLRDFILKECFLDGVISLPVQTFFSNQRKTFIVAVTKKYDVSEVQVNPVFTCLISNIGEKLTSVRRDDIKENDLPNLEYHYTSYINSVDKVRQSKDISEKDGRCKFFDISKFKENNWIIDSWWTHEEKLKLGIVEEKRTATLEDFIELINTAKSSMEDAIKELKKMSYV